MGIEMANSSAAFYGALRHGHAVRKRRALGPLLRAEGLDYARLGILVGADPAPSVLVALPGGIVVQRLGERTTLLLCAALMFAGAVVDLSSDWSARLLARIIAGTGGVVFTIAGTKMIADMFTGRQFGLAMAALAGSWPCGIALALIALPPIADRFGLIGAAVALVILTLTALILLFALPKQARPDAPLSAAFPSAAVTAAVAIAGFVGGTANATSPMPLRSVRCFSPRGAIRPRSPPLTSASRCGSPSRPSQSAARLLSGEAPASGSLPHPCCSPRLGWQPFRCPTTTFSSSQDWGWWPAYPEPRSPACRHGRFPSRRARSEWEFLLRVLREHAGVAADRGRLRAPRRQCGHRLRRRCGRFLVAMPRLGGFSASVSAPRSAPAVEEGAA